MAQKNASPKKAHAQIIQRNGLNSLTWVVVKELASYLFFRTQKNRAFCKSSVKALLYIRQEIAGIISGFEKYF